MDLQLVWARIRLGALLDLLDLLDPVPPLGSSGSLTFLEKLEKLQQLPPPTTAPHGITTKYIDLTGDDDDADDEDNTDAMDLSLDTVAINTTTAVSPMDPEIKPDNLSRSSDNEDAAERAAMIGAQNETPIAGSNVFIPTATGAYPTMIEMNTKNDDQDDLDAAPLDAGSITDLEHSLQENTTHQEMVTKKKAAAAKSLATARETKKLKGLAKAAKTAKVAKPRDKAAKLRKELAEGKERAKQETKEKDANSKEAKDQETKETQQPPLKRGRGRPKKAMVNVEEKEKEEESRRVIKYRLWKLDFGRGSEGMDQIQRRNMNRGRHRNQRIQRNQRDHRRRRLEEVHGGWGCLRSLPRTPLRRRILRLRSLQSTKAGPAPNPNRKTSLPVM
jgi:hypothetical protein